MDNIREILRVYKDKSHQEEQDKILLEPYFYVSKIPSHQNRPKLARALNHWLNIPEDKFQLITEITQTMHDCSLLIDDIQDDSKLRRGMTVAHAVYGLGFTLNAANYTTFKAIHKLSLLNHPEAFDVVLEQMVGAYRGQGMDMYWRESCTIPSEVDYKVMALGKKGGLLMIFLGLMQLFSTNKKDFSQLIVGLSLYFQIIDDYCNMTTEDHNGTKSFCEDLTEGKFSFPIIHALKDEKCKSEVLSIIKQRTNNVELKKYCIGLIESAGGLKYTRDSLEELDRQLREESAKLGPNPYMESFLSDLLGWK